jgi:hypothetical protein
LDKKFHKSFGHGENRTTVSCRFSDARRMHLCQGMSIVNSSHGHGNAFSLDTNLTEVSVIAYGTQRLTKLSEVRTLSSTSPQCTSLPIAQSKYGELRFRTYLLLWTAQHSTRGRLHGQPTLLVWKEPYLKNIRVAVPSICPAESDKPSSDVRSMIALEPAYPVVPRRSKRLSQPPKRFSPGLFLTDAGEPTTYREAIQATDC